MGKAEWINKYKRWGELLCLPFKEIESFGKMLVESALDHPPFDVAWKGGRQLIQNVFEVKASFDIFFYKDAN
jgi:hypothetical protein